MEQSTSHQLLSECIDKSLESSHVQLESFACFSFTVTITTAWTGPALARSSITQIEHEKCVNRTNINIKFRACAGQFLYETLWNIKSSAVEQGWKHKDRMTRQSYCRQYLVSSAQSDDCNSSIVTNASVPPPSKSRPSQSPRALPEPWNQRPQLGRYMDKIWIFAPHALSQDVEGAGWGGGGGHGLLAGETQEDFLDRRLLGGRPQDQSCRDARDWGKEFRLFSGIALVLLLYDAVTHNL